MRRPRRQAPAAPSSPTKWTSDLPLTFQQGQQASPTNNNQSTTGRRRTKRRKPSDLFRRGRAQPMLLSLINNNYMLVRACPILLFLVALWWAVTKNIRWNKALSPPPPSPSPRGLYYSQLSTDFIVCFGPQGTSINSRKKKKKHLQGQIWPPSPLEHREQEEALDTDYGVLDLRLFLSDGMKRVLYKYPRDYQQHTSSSFDDTSENDIDYYYAFDDDAKRNPYLAYSDESVRHSKKCRRTSWHRALPINCNAMHEFDFGR